MLIRISISLKIKYHHKLHGLDKLPYFDGYIFKKLYVLKCIRQNHIVQSIDKYY